MKHLKFIRELFWPLLEKGSQDISNSINQDEIVVDDSHLEKTLEYVIECYKDEKNRCRTIEEKSSLLIGIISVVTSVVVGATFFIIKESVFDNGIIVLYVLLYVFIVYMLRTMWFSIKVLERKEFYVISVEDFFIRGVNDKYYRKTIVEIARKVRNNYSIINKKVDNMTMAQEYFKRFIVLVVLYSFVLLFLFLSKNGIVFKNIINYSNKVEISGWNTLILYVISFSFIVLSLYVKRNNKK